MVYLYVTHDMTRYQKLIELISNVCMEWIINGMNGKKNIEGEGIV